ncbi:hypothetical protein LI291_02810 [Intestinibacillus massiliensis]|nr:hypothetical protein [Intestinibacillus massiliensis]
MKQDRKDSARVGRAILLLLAGTLVPLAGSALSSLLAPAAIGAVSLAGYLLTIAGSALLLPDSRWFAVSIMCAMFGVVADGLPLLYDGVSGMMLYVLTALAMALCYAAVYGGVDGLLAMAGASAGERRLGLWWIACFAAGETLMFVCLYVLPRMPSSVMAQMLGTVAAFACTVCALIYQVRYLLMARRRLG